MDCKLCGAEMEKEGCWEEDKDGKLTIPAVDFFCPECGAEFRKVQGKKLQVVTMPEMPADLYIQTLRHQAGWQ